MAKKTVDFSRAGVSQIPQDKPVVYRIKDGAGNTNYVGTAKRGRARERIQEHLEAGDIPGEKVQIEQKASIQEARKTEARVTARSKPRHNKQG